MGLISMKCRKFHVAQKKVTVSFDHYESLLLSIAHDRARSLKKDITLEEVVKGVVHLTLDEMYAHEVRNILRKVEEDLPDP